MAGSWSGLEMQLASPGIWREDKHPDIRHESWTVRAGGHMNNANKNYIQTRA